MTMCVENTGLTYHGEFSLYVKHEEDCCPGGPNFSKTRGVYAHIAKRPEQVIGVLDTSHSQGGWAVAKACRLLDKKCVLFYPRFKHDANGIKPQQLEAQQLGAELQPIAAGMSAVLYNRVKGRVEYMMPNALKLEESVNETAAEVERTVIPQDINAVLVSASSGTIAAGVIRGLCEHALAVIVHLGYSRPELAFRKYIERMAGFPGAGDGITIIDEGYLYKDVARGEVPPPPFACDKYYDLKAFNWWMLHGRQKYGKALLWNIG